MNMSYVKYRMINYISFKGMNVMKFIVNIGKKIICIELIRRIYFKCKYHIVFYTCIIMYIILYYIIHMVNRIRQINKIYANI